MTFSKENTQNNIHGKSINSPWVNSFNPCVCVCVFCPCFTYDFYQSMTMSRILSSPILAALVRMKCNHVPTTIYTSFSHNIDGDRQRFSPWIICGALCMKSKMNCCHINDTQSIFSLFWPKYYAANLIYRVLLEIALRNSNGWNKFNMYKLRYELKWNEAH